MTREAAVANFFLQDIFSHIGLQQPKSMFFSSVFFQFLQFFGDAGGYGGRNFFMRYLFSDRFAAAKKSYFAVFSFFQFLQLFGDAGGCGGRPEAAGNLPLLPVLNWICTFQNRKQILSTSHKNKF